MNKYLKMAESFQEDRVIEDIASISKFHRIQGSQGLVDAAQFVVNSLAELNIYGTLYKEVYDGLREFANFKVPIAWELVEGEVEIDSRKVSSERTPLVVLAHSPSGECEGKIVAIEREPDWKRAKGKIVLVGENWRENYRKACKVGAIGFIAYRKGLGNAFPYIGLFLKKEDLSWPRFLQYPYPRPGLRRSKKRRM